VIEEEAGTATDQDQDMIPIDDRKQYINWEPDEINRRCSITLGRDSLSELQPIVSDFVSSMVLKHDSTPMVAFALTIEVTVMCLSQNLLVT
jgi:hypothetical protein